MDKLADQLTQVLTKLQDPGIHIARQAVVIDATVYIVRGCFALVFVFILLTAAEYGRKAKWCKSDADANSAIVFGLRAVAALLFVLALTDLANPWTWAAFYAPDAVIAAKILKF